jgi:hypothetical protein
MEYKKKKNGADHSHRNIFIGIGIACAIGLFVLMYVYSAFTMCAYGIDFDQTASAIESMDNDLRIFITDVAPTEQFILTSTALP